jgi:multicomponent Na+:H+ antiporter subunit D
LEKNLPWLELMLILASVGTFLSFAKLCYFTFFVKNEAIEAEEAPVPMQLAMAITAFLCIFIGVYPQSLYQFLPFSAAGYHAYAAYHGLGMIQLFLLAGLVFILARRQFAPHPGIALDFDYFYRLGGRLLLWFCTDVLNAARLGWQKQAGRVVKGAVQFSRDPLRLPEGAFKHLELRISQGADPRSGHKVEALRSKLKEFQGRRAYDENFYRKPIGIGVFLALLLFFVLSFIYLKS